MRSLLVLLLIVSLSGALSAQTSPTPEAQAEAKKLHDEAQEWKWSGVALMAGGLVYEVLGQTSLATEQTYCSVIRNLASCTTVKDPNMGAVYGGALMVGVGAVMLAVGRLKDSHAKKLAPSIAIGPHGFLIEKRLHF